jgi:hypothetical protein
LVDLWDAQITKSGDRWCAVPSRKSKSDKKTETHQKNLPAETKIMQPVVREAQEGILVHFYLACGHMITMRKEDLEESSPSSIECWACEEANKKR